MIGRYEHPNDSDFEGRRSASGSGMSNPDGMLGVKEISAPSSARTNVIREQKLASLSFPPSVLKEPLDIANHVLRCARVRHGGLEIVRALPTVGPLEVVEHLSSYYHGNVPSPYGTRQYNDVVRHVSLTALEGIIKEAGSRPGLAASNNYKSDSPPGFGQNAPDDNPIFPVSSAEIALNAKPLMSIASSWCPHSIPNTAGRMVGSKLGSWLGGYSRELARDAIEGKSSIGASSDKYNTVRIGAAIAANYVNSEASNRFVNQPLVGSAKRAPVIIIEIPSPLALGSAAGLSYNISPAGEVSATFNGDMVLTVRFDWASCPFLTLNGLLEPSQEESAQYSRLTGNQSLDAAKGGGPRTNLNGLTPNNYTHRIRLSFRTDLTPGEEMLPTYLIVSAGRVRDGVLYPGVNPHADWLSLIATTNASDLIYKQSNGTAVGSHPFQTSVSYYEACLVESACVAAGFPGAWVVL